MPPPGGAHLRFYAVDVARGPDGRWWVLHDRTQAPSGAGYALENRLALSHGIPEIYRDLRVRRHAPFFQALQTELMRLNRQDDSRVCVLTPGPMNETYFEHAYLARYLGFLLVEGADLTARDNGVFIRTVSGLKRTEVLLRRLDADFCDPLELNSRSRLGVPGLVQAVREGKVVLANGLGAGVAEARGMLAFLRPFRVRSTATTWPYPTPPPGGSAIPTCAPTCASASTSSWWHRPSAATCRARASATACAAATSNRNCGARIEQSIEHRGVDYRAPGGGAALHHAGMARGAAASRGRSSLRVFLPRQGDGWTGDARRLRAHRRA